MPRPSKIDQVVGYRPGPNGEQLPVAAWERIVQALRTGNYFETACASAGVHRETAYGWLRTAAQLVARAAVQNVDPDDLVLSPYESTCLVFSDAMVRAEAEWEVHAISVLEQLGFGLLSATTTRVKTDAAGEVLETVTTTEALVPDAQVLQWRLTRRFPERYSQRVQVASVDVAGDGPEAAAARLAGEVRAYLQGVHDEAVAAPRAKRSRAKKA
jgi:hypothetical protein